MITGVAFCPQAPALVPDVGRGLDAELAPVRAACRRAVQRVAPAGTRVVVVGGAPVSGEFGPSARASFAGFGPDLVLPLGREPVGAVALPPSLAVGAWLVRDALGPDTGATGFATATGSEDTPDWHGPEPTALIVMGDGSARRTEKAPGYLDERAVGFDAAVVAALSSGDGARLHAMNLDEDVADELMVTGIEAWELAAWELEALGSWDVELIYEGAPFGVGYAVATWTRPAPDAAQHVAERENHRRIQAALAARPGAEAGVDR